MCFTKYYRNFILCGDAEHHCLLCDETFQKWNDIEKHIRWEKHRKALKTQICLTKFKNDGIFKIKTYYYCQYCNHISCNIASVKEHSKTVKHTANKASPGIIPKRIKANYDSGAVIINKIKIESHQWHCVYNKHCLLCKTEVEDVMKHIEAQDHIIRLIQTETKYEGDDKCYRKVNETTFQCFTCMKTFPIEDFDIHWEQHNKIPADSQVQPTSDDSQHPIRIYDREQYCKLGYREYDITQLANIQDDFYNIDIKNKKITCKQCHAAVRNSENDLSNHMINKHKNYSSYKSSIIKKIQEDFEKEYVYIYEKDAGKIRHKLANYGKVNYIKLNAGGSKGYCTLCDRFLSPHINIFKQHVGGGIHTGHLEYKGQIKPKKHKKASTKTEMFSRHFMKIEYLIELEAVAVNLTHCIHQDSFLLLKRIKHGKHFRMTKCFVCDLTLKWWEEKDHCESKIHQSHVLAAKVVADKNNFIREIKPKLYHCGVCNITLPYWETLEKHIDDLSHKTKIREKYFMITMGQFQEQTGNLPESKIIELSTNSEVLYSNIMKVLFENWLSNIQV